MMQISEIYRSLQGESTYAGLACIFVRLTGCNLRCTWCDSEFSFYGGSKMTDRRSDAAEVDKLQLATGNSLVEITGGEPMLQEREVVPLMERLLAAGYKVLLETSGERPLARVPAQVVKIVDVKCPHSGEADTFALDNLASLSAARRTQVRFIRSCGLRIRSRFCRAAPARQTRAGHFVFSGVQQRSKRCARHFSLPA